MIEFHGRGILLDIEGTTSSIRYVYDTLFPFARRRVEAFLSTRRGDPEIVRIRAQIAREAGASDPGDDVAASVSHVLKLMNADAKATGLKELQGLIWREGFESGELRAHVYADVPPALAAWSSSGRDIRIYSSGSVAAQKLFFARTEAGDLTPHLRGFYDTTTGPKREAASYAAIARAMSLPPNEILFLSDIVAELDAAATAGMRTGLARRPGNAPAADDPRHPNVNAFSEITTTGHK